MKPLLIILRWLAAISRVLPFRWSSRLQGFADALATPVSALAGKDARDAAEAVREETEKDVLVMQAKRAKPAEKQK